ncbi:MAG TPA: LysR family transcriptional regulator [Tepidimicrobium sp.]|nr:LysR family transcriptional regulator [Tepidimicrobium sp.]
MNIKSKFWITLDGEKVFGKGPCTLLKMVEKLGSLNKAAKELNMSYSKAWGIINRAERLLGYSLLETKTGGTGGGGSYLTDKAKILIKDYDLFSNEARISLEGIFKKYFKGL